MKLSRRYEGKVSTSEKDLGRFAVPEDHTRVGLHVRYSGASEATLTVKVGSVAIHTLTLTAGGKQKALSFDAYFDHYDLSAVASTGPVEVDVEVTLRR